MDKIKARIEKYKPFILLLAKSKTMQGIAAAAVGTVISYVKAHLPATVLDVAGELITASGISLQAGGLAWAVRGRLNAAGPLVEFPITPPSPSNDVEGKKVGG